MQGLIPNPVWKYMPAATIAQAAPAQNTWYTVLPETANCKLLAIGLMVGTANETLECRLTIDDQVITGNSLAATFATLYYVNLATSETGLALNLSSTISQLGRSFLIEGRKVMVEIRKTTATGAGTLSCAVSYQVR